MKLETKFDVIYANTCKLYKMPYHSQYDQDQYLETTIFKGFQKGVFVDVGAHDGKSFNNTLFFEEDRDWTGINIEPIPDVFARLQAQRPRCINLCCAIDETTGTADFLLNTGYTEMLSGLHKQYDSRHKHRVETEIQKHGGTSTILQVPTRRLDEIFDEHSIDHVHYLSIDVEGAEWSVLKSIDFQKVFVDVIEFENNYPDTSKEIVNYLKEKGYQQIEKSGIDVFMIHKDSQFLSS
jgi:FkbM family methyltransferase